MERESGEVFRVHPPVAIDVALFGAPGERHSRLAGSLQLVLLVRFGELSRDPVSHSNGDLFGGLLSFLIRRAF